MNPVPPPREPLLTELLLLRDGSVLADKLTPAMASVLAQIGLHPHAATHCSLIGGAPMIEEAKHRLGPAASANMRTSSNPNPESKIESAP